MLKRILKMLGAQGASIAFNLVVQLLLPPFFLHSYGVTKYGEWLVLSATVSYLATLNFGITTYTSNELTMLRQRGDMEEYRRLQASTLSFLLILVTVGAVASVGAGLLPLPHLLHLRTLSRHDAGLTAFFLGLMMMSHILGGYYNNLFMVIQQTHRGQMWANVRVFAPTVVAIPLIIQHAAFPEIAFGQFASVLAIALLTIVDLKRRMQGLPLGLRGANWKTAKAAMKPSGMFAMVFMQGFLLFQVPVILMQWLAGPEVVVLFTICRTVFSMARRILSSLTNAIAPEITFSFGSGDLAKLLDIFHYSERVVFAFIPIANLAALLYSPLLLRIWLHKPALFESWTYVLMALVSGVISMREHKQFFQFSTNRHKGLANIVFWGNLIMICVSIPMIMRFGIHGFMLTWLVSESTQMTLLYLENKKLFHADPSITMTPVLKLGAFMALGSLPCILLVNYVRRHSLLYQGFLPIAALVIIIPAAYWIFGLYLVKDRLLLKFANRRRAGSIA